MKKVNEIIIVEGLHDLNFLNTFLNARILTTGGTSLNNEFISQLEKLKKDNSFIILTDPDYPGEYIRNKLLEIIPTAKVGFIRKNKTRKPGTIGVENATKEEILNALENLITYSETNNNITTNDLIDIGMVGENVSKIRHIYSSRHMLGINNNKQFLKKINMLDIPQEEILNELKGIINEQ